MKLFQRIMLLALLVMVGSVEMKAARITATVRGHKISYQSVDANNNPITLSEMVYLNYLDKTIKFVMLNNHPTTTADKLIPTGSEPQIPQVKYMCDGTEECMVVCPDYLGYGATKSTTHPYMCATLTARNIVDGEMAAIKYAKSNGYTFVSGYYTLNVGYSQGGAATLAVQKYLETEASDDVRSTINLQRSICGAGPHLQSWMFDQMENYESMFYSLYIPYTIEGLKYTFGNSTMRALSREEIYTEKFLNSGLLEQVLEKNTVAADMNTAIADFFGGSVNFYDIIRPEYKDRNSKLYRTLQKALKQCDLLEGWKPQASIVFYHWKGDEVVPYEQSVMAWEKFSKMGCDVILRESDDVPATGWENAAKIIGKKVTDDHMGRGLKFYLSLFSGDLR